MKKTTLFIGGVAAVAAALYGYFRRKEKHTAEPNDEDIDGGVVSYTSKTAPKEIKSRLIVRFSCEMSTFDMTDEDDISGKVYSLEAVLENGAVKGSYKWRDRFGNSDNKPFRASARFMYELYAIVREYDLAKHNGQSYTVTGLPDMYGAMLNVYFASKEIIYAYDNQSNFIPCDAMKKLILLFENNANKVEYKPILL